MAKSNELHPLTKSLNGAAVYGAGDSQSSRGGDAGNAPLCIYYYHWLSNCRDFLQLNPKERRDVAMRFGKCLRDHFVKDYTFGNNCRRCQNDWDKKHFFLLHDYKHRPPETSSEPAVTRRSVKTESKKALYNRVTVARVVNSATRRSKLVYCQHDPGPS